ncbi:nose resistant to fluoxetine protein 6 isoform X2 [Culex quinquefasciatus]|uniref:nose resistant to fluoxetine protein 6 isoform X2 n=1 Tax=Culex quinquefasciatus TaxID=7176 RepID=UPI0018E31F5E|nr:nose resistant to fluoxetine protein 6 isoform X2 [Culex quinquefasciatus]
MASGGDAPLRVTWSLRPAVGIVVLLSLTPAVRASVSENASISMPAMHHFEDKFGCLRDNPANIYCVAKTVIKPDENSPVWKLIERNSREHTNYRHYILDRGFCLQSCQTLVRGLSEDQQKRYDHEVVQVDEFHIFGPGYITGMEEYKRKYGSLVNVCLNYRLQQSYNLSGYSEIEHCMTAQELDKPVNILHVVFAVLYGTVLVLVMRATLLDFRVIRNHNNNHVVSDQPDSVWMEFSLKRSFRRLTVAPQTKIQRDFAYVEGFRVLTVLLISSVHTTMGFGISPMVNPEALEGLFGTAFMRMTAAIFPMLVHTFFTISGLLLAVNFLEFIETGPRFRWSLFFSGVLSRYLRMVPAYFVLWLYQISWSDRLGDGPFDYRITGVERQMCKINGWSNFLFINNYFNWDKGCMQQSWYMAADFQFYLVGMLIMMLIWRFPKSTKTLIALMMTFSILAPIVHVYVNNFAEVIQINFRHLRMYLFQYKSIGFDYILAHTNTSAYFSGIIAGIVYHRVQSDPKYLRTIPAYGILKRVAPLMVLAMAAPATLFYNTEPLEPSLWRSVYASVHRNFYGTMCGVALLYWATDGSWKIPALAKHPAVLAVGRLSFSVYLVQFNAIRAYFVDVDGDGIELNVVNFLRACGLVMLYSYVFGLLLCTTVELPVAAVIRRLQGFKKSTKTLNTSSNGTTDQDKLKAS